MRNLIALAIAALLGVASFGFNTAAAQIQSATILIDSSTTQPVSTGIISNDATDAIVVFSEGAGRVPAVSRPYTNGWFDPAGVPRLQRAGQPVVDGMPYGAVLATYTSSLVSGSFVGRQGDINVQLSHEGHEWKVGLNMSAADLATLDGSFVVHFILIPDGEALTEEVVIDASTGQPVGTGFFVTDPGDIFIVLPYGALRVFNLPGNPYTHHWFGPEGKTLLNRSGQPEDEAPYGCLLGTFSSTMNAAAFYVGCGRTWDAQPVDVGSEFKLGLNMDDDDLAAASGRFIANVAFIPAAGAAGLRGTEPEMGAALGQSFPNPGAHPSIGYALAEADHVHLRIYDSSGRVVRTLTNGQRSAGAHDINWDGRDAGGREVPAGTYFYQLSTSEGSQTRKLVLTR